MCRMFTINAQSALESVTYEIRNLTHCPQSVGGTCACSLPGLNLPSTGHPPGKPKGGARPWPSAPFVLRLSPFASSILDQDQILARGPELLRLGDLHGPGHLAFLV